jgi:Xaa-Pro aminopeptidase
LFTGLKAGAYTMSVTSARNCSSNQVITIEEPSLLSIFTTVNVPFACNVNNSVDPSTIIIMATDGTPPYLYSIDGVNYITDNTFRRLLKFIKPGVMENEIEAEIWHSFLTQRATGPAYGNIIASGDRARTLHYVANNQECKNGEMILMDFGAEYGGYNADLTRTIPVNGKFTARQKKIYNTCLDLHNSCKAILKPGISILEYHDKAGDIATELFLKAGLLRKSEVKNEDPENRAYRKYLYHGISHHLGVDVHDLGTMTEPIKQGMVFTVEPGIYIEEEKMGIRIENNVWITKNGNKDLMKNIPVTVDEIEALMKK